MSEPDLQAIIQDQLDTLPEDVRAQVQSNDWRKVVYDIGRKNNLKIDQLGALEQEVFYIMIGLIPAKEFLSDLVNKSQIARDVAGSIVREIDVTVFEKMRKFVMEMDALEDGPEAKEIRQAEEFPGQPVSISSREDLLREIEEIGEDKLVPPPAPPAPPVQKQEAPVPYSPVETNLTTPVVAKPVNLDETISSKTPETPTETPQPPKTADPYREIPS